MVTDRLPPEKNCSFGISTRSQNSSIFTIITVNRNRCHGLRATLQSIQAQTYSKFELIVVDGHSTDESNAVIESFKEIITRVEKDKESGIYAAMNQGARLATGEWVIFMNAGDVFFDSDVLAKAQNLLQGDLAYGRVWRVEQHAPVRHQLLENLWKGNAFCHQALFTRTSWVKRFPFETCYEIIGDYHFYVVAMKNKAQFHALDLDVAIIEAIGLADKYPLKLTLERYRVVKRYFPDQPIHLYYLARLIKILIKKVFLRYSRNKNFLV